MTDPGGVVAPVAFSFGASLAGAAVALLTRAWVRRRGRQPSLLEAGWCAFLPLAAVLLVPLLAAFQPHALSPLGGTHDLWHRWEDALHRSTLGHTALHVANWLLLGIGAALLGRTIFALSRMWSFEDSLRRSIRGSTAERVHSLSSVRPLCFTAGLLRPAVYMTTGLCERLGPRDLRAVLAHEAAHLRRRDTLISATLTLFYTLLPVPGSGLLLQDWRLAVERACDRHAAREVGSPYDVAVALVRVAGLVAQGPVGSPNSFSFTDWGEDVEGRVQALLRTQGGEQECGWTAGLLTAFSIGLLFSAALWLPHAVELFAHH